MLTNQLLEQTSQMLLCHLLNHFHLFITVCRIFHFGEEPFELIRMFNEEFAKYSRANDPVNFLNFTTFLYLTYKCFAIRENSVQSLIQTQLRFLGVSER